MPNVSRNSINLSVKNATEYVNSIKAGERTLAFYLGSVDTPSISTNSETKRNDVYKEASFFKRIEKSEIDIVSRKINFGGTAFQTWNPYDDNIKNYYTVYNNNVYLVIGNDLYNTDQNNEQLIATTLPTHTDGIQKYSDGYEYLYLYTLNASNPIVTSNNLWMPVPDTTMSYYSGKLIYKKIDANSISDITISYKDPEITILSDTGTGAKIRLKTVVQTSPSVTVSNRKYKIIGIEVINIGDTAYIDYDISSSLSAVMTKESSANISRIASAITLGFSSIEGFNLRNLLQAQYSIITLIANTEDIESVIEQTQFNSFGIVEDIKDDSDNLVFTPTSTTKIVSNNVKITATQLSGSTSILDDFEVKTTLTLQNKTKYSKGKVASSKLSGGSSLVSEIEISDKNQYQINDTLKSAKSSSVYIINSVTRPSTKAFSGKVLHIGSTNFSTEGSSPKTFVAQVIQRF